MCIKWTEIRKQEGAKIFSIFLYLLCIFVHLKISFVEILFERTIQGSGIFEGANI